MRALFLLLALTLGLSARASFVYNGSGGGGGAAATWGSITGTLSSQTDLSSALGAKLGVDGSVLPTGDFNWNGHAISGVSTLTATVKAQVSKVCLDGSGANCNAYIMSSDGTGTYVQLGAQGAQIMQSSSGFLTWSQGLVHRFGSTGDFLSRSISSSSTTPFDICPDTGNGVTSGDVYIVEMKMVGIESGTGNYISVHKEGTFTFVTGTGYGLLGSVADLRPVQSVGAGWAISTNGGCFHITPNSATSTTYIYKIEITGHFN